MTNTRLFFVGFTLISKVKGVRNLDFVLRTKKGTIEKVKKISHGYNGRRLFPREIYISLLYKKEIVSNVLKSKLYVIVKCTWHKKINSREMLKVVMLEIKSDVKF